MTVKVETYKYNQTFYTGTDIQPDMLTVFVKNEKQHLLPLVNMPLANRMGYYPIISIISGAARIVNAVKEIFKILSEKDTPKSELWNAFKNIFRGIVEIIPFTGLTLVLFDSFRYGYHFSKISEELKDKENIACVAIDGKIVSTVDLGIVDSIVNKWYPNANQIESRLPVFNLLCLEILKNAETNKSKAGMSAIFTQHNLETLLKSTN
jgi:hypothetical protein